MSNFSIDIINPHWIDNKVDNDFDTCSHGEFILTIGGHEILNANDKADWTTCTSVLQLLRGIEDDFTKSKNQIILHCSGLMMLSCPVGIYWKLNHDGSTVIIREIKKQLAISEIDAIKFPMVASIDLEEYKREVLNVAKKVKEFYNRSKPRVVSNDKYDIEEYKKFWNEFDSLYEKYSKI